MVSAPNTKMEVHVKYKWIDHEQNIISEFANLWKQELFTDCTIFCGGKRFPVHRLVLASCSEYFKEVFDNAQCCHPIIIMNDISSENFQILLDYIYQGNLVIPQRKLLTIIEESRALKIKGFEVPSQLLCNTSSNAKSDKVKNLRLLQKSLSPVVVFTKLGDVRGDFLVKRKVPKEWDVKHKIRKIDSAYVEKEQVTKNGVQDEDIISSISEISDLENIFDHSEEVNFIGLKTRREQVQLQKPVEEEIFKEEVEDMQSFPLQKSCPHETSPKISQSTAKTDGNQEKELSGKAFHDSSDWNHVLDTAQTTREFSEDPDLPSDDVETAVIQNPSDCEHVCESAPMEEIPANDSISISDELVEEPVIQNPSDCEHVCESAPMEEIPANDSISNSDELVEEPDWSVVDSPRRDGRPIEENVMLDGSASKTEMEEQEMPSHSQDPKTTSRTVFNYQKINQVPALTTYTEKSTCERFRQYRPCPFCFKYIKRFAAHLRNKHRNEKEVQEIRETRDETRRKRLFHLLRVKGLEIENEKRKGKKDLLRIKRSNVTQKENGNLQYQCVNCKMIYSKMGISNHKGQCHPKDNKPARGRGVIHYLPFEGKVDERLEFLDKKFLPEVVNPMHEGALKTEILSDIELLYIGNYLYVKHLSGREMKSTETTRKKLRYLTHIKIKFNNLPSNRPYTKFSLSEIFNMNHWYKLKKLLREMINLNQEKKLILKRGVANLIKYAIDEGLDALIGLYMFTLGEDATLVVQSLNKFKDSYLSVRDSLFGKFSVIRVERRAENKEVARPPSKQDMAILIQKCNRILNAATMFEIFSESMFLEIRRAAVTRLALFNGRRPSEIALLKVREWELAKNNCYLPSDQVNILKEKTNYNLLDDFKIMTLGTKDDVSVVVPKLLFKVLDMLSDPEIRYEAGVLTGTKSSNPYLFPSTRRSLMPCSGTECVEKFLNSALPESTSKFSNVQVRYLLANKFVMEDYPEDTRKKVFRFFGFTELINELNHKYPNVRNVLKMIATALSRIEAGFAEEDTIFSELSWAEDDDPDLLDEDDDTEAQLDEFQSDVRVCSKMITHNLYKKTPLPKSNVDLDEGNSSGLLTSDVDVSREEEEEKTPSKACWPSEHNKIFKEEFEDYISGSKNYPKKGRILNFLLAYPNILAGFEVELKEKKIRIKLNNARRIRKQKEESRLLEISE